MFGSKKDSLSWLHQSFPPPTDRTQDLADLRDQVAVLQRELKKERDWNQEIQATISSRRRANDELVAMMALLRTETEAVVSRHNTLLESQEAKDAAQALHAEEQKEIPPEENGSSVPTKVAVDNANDGDDEGDEEDEDGEIVENGAVEKRGLEDGDSPRSTKRRKV